MPNANLPSGPGKPISERRDAAKQAEGADELAADREGTPQALDNASRHARQAERDASVPERGGKDTGGRSSS
jgi:hypothetical protein